MMLTVSVDVHTLPETSGVGLASSVKPVREFRKSRRLRNRRLLRFRGSPRFSRLPAPATDAGEKTCRRLADSKSVEAWNSDASHMCENPVSRRDSSTKRRVWKCVDHSQLIRINRGWSRRIFIATFVSSQRTVFDSQRQFFDR